MQYFLILIVDELYEYRNKLKSLVKEDLKFELINTDYYSDKCIWLFEKLWEINPKLRYQSSRALKHPWITKEENGRIPMNMYDEIQRSVVLFDKLKMIQKAMLWLSIIKDNHIQGNKMKELDEYKWRIIKEEFLEFDPTPKSGKNKMGQIQVSFNRLSSKDIDDENKDELWQNCDNLASNIDHHLIIPK